VHMTRYQRAADALLRMQDTTLVDFLLDQADEGVPGEVIARKLRDRTEGAIDVTGEAVRNWIKRFREERQVAS
jgi:hypothetical protein